MHTPISTRCAFDTRCYWMKIVLLSLKPNKKLCTYQLFMQVLLHLILHCLPFFYTLCISIQEFRNSCCLCSLRLIPSRVLSRDRFVPPRSLVVKGQVCYSAIYGCPMQENIAKFEYFQSTFFSKFTLIKPGYYIENKGHIKIFCPSMRIVNKNCVQYSNRDIHIIYKNLNFSVSFPQVSRNHCNFLIQACYQY